MNVADATQPDVTQLLDEWAAGDTSARERLMPLVYDPLRRIAAQQLKAERSNHTLQPTALVNELYLRLIGQNHAAWKSRRHFYALAAQMMRRILIDHARAHCRVKRGGKTELLPLEAAEGVATDRPDDLLALDTALNSLAKIDPRKARIVELRYFGGMTLEEIAKVIGVAGVTVRRQWKMAKAWLFAALSED